MKCNICGRQTQNEEANFCEYCGGSFRERMQTPNNMPTREQGFPYMNGQAPMMMPPQAGNMAYMPKEAIEEKPVSFLNFLGSYSIFFIPIAGWLIFIIMLFVWAFSGKTPSSKKNWARATLIFAGVGLVILVAYFMYVISSPIYQQMMNGTFNYNDYINSLKP